MELTGPSEGFKEDRNQEWHLSNWMVHHLAGWRRPVCGKVGGKRLEAEVLESPGNFKMSIRLSSGNVRRQLSRIRALGRTGKSESLLFLDKI